MTAYVYPDMSVDALASATPLNAADVYKRQGLYYPARRAGRAAKEKIKEHMLMK